MPFVKLDTKILNSTIWALSPEREIFLTALLMAEPREFTIETPALKVRSLKPTGFVIPPGWYGFVEAAGPGIVKHANIDAEDGLKALERLAEPEPESRSQAFDGRRMVRVDGGYVILNFMAYRDKDHTAAERQRRLRARRREESRVTSRNVTQSDSREQKAEADLILSGGGEEKSGKRERNPVFDALCEIEGIPLNEIGASGGRIAKALAVIRKSTPNVTAEEIHRRATNYRSHFDHAALTARALAEYWGKCHKPNERPATHQRPNSRGYAQQDDYSGV